MMPKPINRKFTPPDPSNFKASANAPMVIDFGGGVTWTISVESTQRILEEADKNAPIVGREKALKDAAMNEIYRQNGVIRKKR